jgi:hypothetical protein
MTGNVDERVLNTQGKINEPPFRSTLKGGYFGPLGALLRSGFLRHAGGMCRILGQRPAPTRDVCPG